MSVQLMFPEELIELNKEITRNQALQEVLCKLPINADLSDKLGEIAAFCGVILDGYYVEKDLRFVCKRLADELRNVREAKELIIIR